MEVLEAVVLLAGAIIFTVSFFIPGAKGKTNAEDEKLAREEIKTLVSQEMDGIKGHVEDVVDEAIGYAVEKTERSLERLTNEKIMAVNEYSDTVLKEIHKNHEEALFLYDMLNSKHANIKDTVSKVNKSVKEAEEATREVEAVVNNFQKIVPEAVAVTVENQPETVEKETATPVEKPMEPANNVMEAEVANMDISFMQTQDHTGQNSNEKILELYRQGKSKVAIAKELGLGVGEVKLVIDLYKNI